VEGKVGGKGGSEKGFVCLIGFVERTPVCIFLRLSVCH